MATDAQANDVRAPVSISPIRAAHATRPPREILRFGVPRGGRIEEPVLEFLASCGLRVRKEGERQLTAEIRGLPGVTVILQRQRDIMLQVAEGKADVGITGQDLVQEYGREGDDVVMLYENLGFSKSDMVVAVPDSWLDVSTLADLSDVAAALRERGDDLRVATSFPILARRFFYANGITHFTLVHTEGGVEAAPGVGFADVVVDVTSTGTTLRENNLKVLRNGTILRSQACLVGNRRALAASREKREVTRRILEQIEARLRAESYYSVTANMRGVSERDVAEALLATPATRGERGPTVARVYTTDDLDGGGGSGGGSAHDGPWFAATIIVREQDLLPAVDHLRDAGGSGVSVLALRYLFDSRSNRYEAMLKELGVRDG